LSKILVIRFSSFGDVTQALSIPTKLQKLKNPEIHWVTRSDFVPLLEGHPHIQKIWPLKKQEGITALLQLIFNLRKENFTHIYDAHNNLRSLIISLFLAPPFSSVQFIRKSQKRWKRFLLFSLKKNTYQMPFSGQRDLLEPLAKWGIDESLPPPPQIFIHPKANEFIQNWRKENQIQDYICFAPSAAHTLKRWPMTHWKKLIEMNPQQRWVALGGAEDSFIQDFPSHIFNMAGKTSYQETAALILQSKCLVTNDTGVLHIAEQLGHPAIALMGPAPFGFPSRPSTCVLELMLSCRPCSKHGQGPCRNPSFHECLIGISPELVHAKLQNILGNKS